MGEALGLSGGGGMSGNVMVEPSLRVLALVTDAFGGRGGIAQYNRDFLSSLATCDRIGDVIVLPRARGGRDRGLLERLIACAEMNLHQLAG